MRPISHIFFLSTLFRQKIIRTVNANEFSLQRSPPPPYTTPTVWEPVYIPFYVPFNTSISNLSDISLVD